MGDISLLASLVSSVLWIFLTYEILRPSTDKRRWLFWGLFSAGTLSTFVVVLTMMETLNFWG